jgi:ribosomal protein L17
MKNDIEKLAEKATEMQKKVYELIASGTKDDLMMSSAILMKTAIELYTVVLPDEAIENMLTNEVVNSIPAIREKMEGSLKVTVH